MRGFSIIPTVIASTVIAGLVAGASGCVGPEPTPDPGKTDSSSTMTGSNSTTTTTTTTSPTCPPQCTNRNCGSDSCGGTCGSCPGGQTCSSSGVCESSTPLALVGDPCTTNSQCASGNCLGEWCSASCTSDASCGAASNGIQNRCVKNNESQSVCFPGCTSNANCTNFVATICESDNSGVGDICSYVGPPNYGNNQTCNTCLVQFCGSQDVACEEDSSCVSFFTCVQPCGTDTTCQNDCIDVLSSTTATTADNLLQCINSNCASCGVPQ